MNTKDRIRRLFVNNLILGNIRDFPYDSYLKIRDSINIKDTKRVLVYTETDLMKEITLTLLTKCEEFISTKTLNMFSLVDIFLGHNEEVNSVLNLPYKNLILYGGYNEMANKQTAPITTQVMSDYAIKNKRLWLIVKGDQALYNQLLKTANELKYELVDLSSVRATTKTSMDIL